MFSNLAEVKLEKARYSLMGIFPMTITNNNMGRIRKVGWFFNPAIFMLYSDSEIVAHGKHYDLNRIVVLLP